MDKLNDDCQYLIISRLNLTDQFILFEATNTETTKRWTTNIQNVWARKLSHSLNYFQLGYFEKYLEVFHQFMSSICPTVHQLEIQFGCSSYLSDRLRYSGTKSVIFKQYFSATSIPNLKDLIIYGNYWDEEDSKSLVSLHKLQTLTLSPVVGWDISKILNMRGKDITKLVLTMGINLNSIALNKLSNLRQLTLYCVLLEDMLSYQEYLWDFVACCPSLKIVNFSELENGEYFFKIRHIARDLDRRPIPLTLNFDISEDCEIHFNMSHPKLKISYEEVEIEELPDSHAVKFYFNSNLELES